MSNCAKCGISLVGIVANLPKDKLCCVCRAQMLEEKLGVAQRGLAEVARRRVEDKEGNHVCSDAAMWEECTAYWYDCAVSLQRKVAALREAVLANHKWHQDFDFEDEGYKGSELEIKNVQALSVEGGQDFISRERLQDALNAVRVPEGMAPTKAELFKAAVRSVITEINKVLKEGE
ncbi:MAG TPA: hypothetical protein VEC99_11945 [Clostridia bacterium]|nr:hypothetical protein [Clostridia bacterium]